MSPQFCESIFSVLGYHEDGEWVALALELDLRGYGDTWEDALKELTDCIAIQISFAEFKGQPDMIMHPAESIYFELFAQVKNDKLRNLYVKNIDPEYQTGGLQAPPAHVIEEHKKAFASG